MKKIDPFYIIAAIALIGLLLFRQSNAPEDISGQKAPQFTSMNIEGQEISLSDFRGSYVLLDFWGSWCGPCRRANPKLVDTYHKYKDKGLVVINIAIENNPDAWKAAIAKDNLDWPHHIMEDQNQGTPISDSYDVKSIPTKFLISPEGVIIATNPGFGKIGRIMSKESKKN